MAIRIRSRILPLLLSIIAVGASLPFAPALADGTSASLLPSSQNIAVGQTTTVTVRLTDVQSLFGYQVEIGFDPAVLEVLDGDLSKPGVQVSLGTFLKPDFVQQNNADNVSGRVAAVVSQLAPSAPVSGSGDLVTVSFRGKVEGYTAITFVDLKLAKSDGHAISATRVDAQITVGNPNTPTPTATTPANTPTPTATTPPGGSTPTPTPTPSSTPAPGQTIVYFVRTGDTLYSIARRHGTTVQAIAQINAIANPSYITVGQRLLIPRDGYATPIPPTPVPGSDTYVVQRGDTLWSISRRYGTTVQAIALLNRIANPSLIYAGQRLILPAGSSTPAPTTRVHVVQWGETLYSIARRYNTTHWAIAMANHLVNPNVIYAGQRLVIP